MIAILLADGFEEIEALTPLDVLLRAGKETKTVSINENKKVVGAHGISVMADLCQSELDLENIELLILPGGMPGAINLDSAEITDRAIDAVMSSGGHLAAICASPLVLGRRGLLRGKRATCYPGFESELIGAEISEEGVVTDGNITTAQGMGVALRFALELTALTAGEEVARNIASAVMCDFEFTPAQNGFSSKIYPFTEPVPYTDKNERSETAEFAEAIYTCAEELGLTLELKEAKRGNRFAEFLLGSKKWLSKKRAEELRCKLAEKLRTPVRILHDEATACIFIEKREKYTPTIGKYLTSEEFSHASSPLSVLIGVTDSGDGVYTSLESLPHLLILGESAEECDGMLDCIILSLITKSTPDKVKLLLGDTDGDFLHSYDRLPHLGCPVADGSRGIAILLLHVVQLMEERYSLLSERGVRNLNEYNELMKAEGKEPLEKLAVIIRNLPKKGDKFKKQFEDLIIRITQKSRPAGIHLVLSTTDVSGYSPSKLHFSNFSSSVCFKTDSNSASRELTGTDMAPGLFSGELLYRYAGAVRGIRLDRVKIPASDKVRAVECTPAVSQKEKATPTTHADEPSGTQVLSGIDIMMRLGEITPTVLARELAVSEGLAEKIIELVMEIGILGEPDENNVSKVIVTEEEWKAFQRRVEESENE